MKYIKNKLTNKKQIILEDGEVSIICDVLKIHLDEYHAKLIKTNEHYFSDVWPNGYKCQLCYKLSFSYVTALNHNLNHIKEINNLKKYIEEDSDD